MFIFFIIFPCISFGKKVRVYDSSTGRFVTGNIVNEEENANTKNEVSGFVSPVIGIALGHSFKLKAEHKGTNHTFSDDSSADTGFIFGLEGGVFIPVEKSKVGFSLTASYELERDKKSSSSNLSFSIFIPIANDFSCNRGIENI